MGQKRLDSFGKSIFGDRKIVQKKVDLFVLAVFIYRRMP